MSEELANTAVKMALPKKLMASEDYFDWAFTMKNALQCRNANLWFIIDGTLVRPTRQA